ncbi:aldehyde ferredoxin oxidoreductase family protein, partial [Chloroflexota bacterium]
MSNVTSRGSKVIILEVDLSSGKVEKRDLGWDMRAKYIGGRGVNAKLLYDNVTPEIDAYSPGNLVLFGTGPMAGTGAAFSTRMSTLTKSNYCVYGHSDIGGYFAPELRRAGYDHIVVKGKADQPVYIWIDDDEVEIRSAVRLWGKGVRETDRLIKEELGDPGVRVAAIGQAGENLVRYADVVIVPERAGGSRGMGAAMGSKKLKAIAVRGTGHIGVANEELVRKMAKDFIARVKERPFCDSRTQWSGSHMMNSLRNIGAAPIKNLTTKTGEELNEATREAMAQYYTARSSGCPGCPVRHWPSWEINEGPYAGEHGWGLEGGVSYPYVYNVLNSNLPSVFVANSLLNDYGMDASESSTIIAAAMEWFEKGIVTKEDLDGMELKWGDHEAIIKLIHKIARREGIGDLLAEGCVRAAEKIGKGAKDCISYGKGRTSGILDWRTLKGSYLNEVTSSPPCEMMDGMSGIECYDFLLPRTPEVEAAVKEKFGTVDVLNALSYNKAGAVVYYQDLSMVLDILEFCLFASEWTAEACTIKDMADQFQAVTGIDMGVDDLIKAARRVRA